MKQTERYVPMFLYLLLAAGLSLAVLAAAEGYAAASDYADMGARARVSGQFVRMKAWQSSGIHATDGTLRMRESYPEGEFDAVLYLHGGWLTEQLVAAGSESAPAMGDKVVPCGMFGAETLGNVLRVSTENGDAYLYKPSAGGGH